MSTRKLETETTANDVIQCCEPQTRQPCEQQDNADAEVNDVREITDDEQESHVNSECNELVVTAEAELPANDGDAKVDVGQDGIHTNDKVEHRTDPEGDDKGLEKIEKEIVHEQTETPDSIASELEGQDLELLDHFVPVVLGNLLIQEGKQRQKGEGHALSGTQEGSNLDAPKREAESGVLRNRPGHRSTDTKADVLRMSGAENGMALEHTHPTPAAGPRG
ncbi:hypothetical protein FQA39_LY16537 [Lamprigera yunnana]|nr:hypothetical protein FQA39_LY16537 [Lamprigera yunnana]